MENDCLEGLKIRLVIMSRGRAGRMTTHRLVPQATLVVPEDQAAEYAAAYPQELVTIPPDRVGVSQVRNWIVARFPEEVVVMFDDDVTGLQTICAVKNRRLDADEIAAVVENTAY